MEIKKSEFKLIDFLVQDASISRKPVESKGEVVIDISPSATIDDKNNIFQLTLEFTLSEPESNRFNIFIRALGFFGFNDTIEKENLPNLFYINAPAILFPYIRAYIAALTALSGMEALHLQPMNLLGIQDELKKNTEVFKEEGDQ